MGSRVLIGSENREKEYGAKNRTPVLPSLRADRDLYLKIAEYLGRPHGVAIAPTGQMPELYGPLLSSSVDHYSHEPRCCLWFDR